MQIVIKIPDLDYFDIKHGHADNYQRERLVESVKRSIAIPKNHGRLIDADFEENHYASILTNPTPDVTEYDKENAKVILKALKMMGTVIKADKEVEHDG